MNGLHLFQGYWAVRHLFWSLDSEFLTQRWHSLVSVVPSPAQNWQVMGNQEISVGWINEWANPHSGCPEPVSAEEAWAAPVQSGDWFCACLAFGFLTKSKDFDNGRTTVIQSRSSLSSLPVSCERSLEGRPGESAHFTSYSQCWCWFCFHPPQITYLGSHDPRGCLHYTTSSYISMTQFFLKNVFCLKPVLTGLGLEGSSTGLNSWCYYFIYVTFSWVVT